MFSRRRGNVLGPAWMMLWLAGCGGDEPRNPPPPITTPTPPPPSAAQNPCAAALQQEIDGVAPDAAGGLSSASASASAPASASASAPASASASASGAAPQSQAGVWGGSAAAVSRDAWVAAKAQGYGSDDRDVREPLWEHYLRGASGATVAAARPAASQDIGDIAVLEDDGTLFLRA